MGNGKPNAYLTVYLSLMFGVILSLLLALIEGAAIGATRLQSEIVADLALDSVFAEYNRELLNQYNLFFIDTSYGTKKGGMENVENHLADYMSYNLDPKKDMTFVFGNTYLGLENEALGIEKMTYATDDDCLVWKTAAVNYMKSVYGGDIVNDIKEYVDKAQENGLTTRDVIEELKQKKEELDRQIEEKMIEEYGEVKDKGYTYDKVSNLFDDLVGGTMLKFVTPSGSKMSDAVVEGGPYYSARANSGKLNKGSGLHEGVDKADGLIDELIYNEYLMSVCGTYTDPKENGQLKYQMEYILYGCNNDSDNMKKSVECLFGLRAVSNLICIYDSPKKLEVAGTVLAVCTFIGLPGLAEPITDMILAVMALAESICDVKILLDKGKVPLMKGDGDWNISITGLLSGRLFDADKNTNGLTYNGHLRIFAAFANQKDKVARSLDIVEMDIRKTEGNSRFRIDQCADYMEVQFGFSDGFGNDYLITRSRCYD